MDQSESSTRPNQEDSSENDRNFESLNIHEVLIKWLHHKNLRKMTRVQSLSIKPFLKKGNDVLVQSCTGSGKTLCFILPILHTYLETDNYDLKNLLDVFSVIILPTRELAIQVAYILIDSLTFLENEGPPNGTTKKKHTFTIKGRNLYCSQLIGGTTVENDIKFLSEAKDRTYVKSLVVATPGRLSHLIDLLKHEHIWSFKNLNFLILDEADRLLEMGYQRDMSQILTHLPKQRKTGMFSATLSSGVQTLSKLCLSNQIFINADEGSQNDNKYNSRESKGTTSYATPKQLNNYYLILNTQEKLHFLLLFIEYLKKAESRKLVVFFLTCDLVDYFYEVMTRLSSQSDPVECEKETYEKNKVHFYKIHRKMTTKRRTKNHNSFRSNSNEEINVLLCTDIFSRGIDIPKIDWIIQFDPPQDPNFYLHRIGRAGRAEDAGNALLLLTEPEEPYIQFQVNRKIKLDELPSMILNEVKNENKHENEIPFVLKDNKVENDTKVSENRNYFEYLKENGIDNPVLEWERTSVILAHLRRMNSKNRDLMLTSYKAFVSYTRAYSEHNLKNIFEKMKLDYGSLAKSLGVLRIPRVKEILGKKISNFVQSTTNPSDVPFLDPEKESKRISAMKEFTPEKKNIKKEKEQKVKRTRSEKRITKRKNTYDEWNEFRREEALVKKIKKKMDPRSVKKFLKREETDLDEEFDDLNGDLEHELNNPKALKKWILRGKKRKKKR